MQAAAVLGVLEALANDTRLRVVRHLLDCGPQGTTLQHAAMATGLSHNDLVPALEELHLAALIVRPEEGAHGYYAIDRGRLRQLLDFLLPAPPPAPDRPHGLERAVMAPPSARDEPTSFFRS